MGRDQALLVLNRGVRLSVKPRFPRNISEYISFFCIQVYGHGALDMIHWNCTSWKKPCVGGRFVRWNRQFDPGVQAGQ